MTVGERAGILLEEAGAVAYGVTEAREVDDGEWRRFEQWLGKGFHAGMAYMENYRDIRRDPRKLLEGARSIISVAFNYRQPNPVKGLATYALGEDYHKVLRKRLKPVARTLKGEFGGDWRICIDSAPILERYWAERAGVGRRSPLNGNIVVAGAGSMVFLAEIITTLEIEERSANFVSASREVAMSPYDAAVCPGGALHEGGVINSARCINYLTIEHKGDLGEEESRLAEGALFGCDACQLACVSNAGEAPGVLPEFRPLPGLREFLTEGTGDFDLKKSPLSRSERIRNSRKN